MMKRLFYLAQELEVDSETLLGVCKHLDIDVRNAMSSLDDDEQDKIRTEIGGLDLSQMRDEDEIREREREYEEHTREARERNRE